MKKFSIIFAIFLVSCGGGGGGSDQSIPSTPLPKVNLSADPSSVLLGDTSSLTWSSSNTSSCSSSWTSQTSTSGSEVITISSTGNNSFSISCSGNGRTGSASVIVEGFRNTEGVIVDGYVSGAEVCIDKNENWSCDTDENSTTSDNNGAFSIKYDNGNLISIGGTDLDSQILLENFLITHDLSGHSEFKAVTPVTSIAAFMADSSEINSVLGIDESIDVSTFDPVANKGDGGINDYLYEKGNQLTILAFALQNITNNLNTTTETTQDYFRAISEEIEKEYTETSTKVDIETNAFVSKVLDNVSILKSLTIDESAKSDTAKALSGVMPIIEVKSSSELTAAVIRFAISTLQNDIKAISDGSASDEIITSYTTDILNYIAEDQDLDPDEIAPNINAINDSVNTFEDSSVTINVLANDSYVTTAPINITAMNGSNGLTYIAESIPYQITYTPDSDFNGMDTFSYTITQGEKTSSADVNITIEAVNDAPSIDIASTIEVLENETTVTTVSISDLDGDTLTLNLDGTDADSFNLSSENILTFKEPPDYESKNSYSITLILTDGLETVSKNITILIIKEGSNLFFGEVIDGYISGAEIFIDQNFNFKKDDGEFTATTLSDGTFIIDVDDSLLYECLENRPIVANVPVGAIDSTLGVVEQAYQMVLPSISDTGNETIVISPFTSLFAAAILSAKESIDEELTLEEGCESAGDNLAAQISSKITDLKSSIENNFGITYDQLISDFIENPSDGVNELIAQNIAKLLPYLQIIDDQVSDSLSTTFEKDIRANVSLSEDALGIIFGGEDYEKLPLNFYSNYSTSPNSEGWYRSESLEASGAFISKDGILSRADCSESDTELCNITDLSLKNIANASTLFNKASSFSKNSPIDFDNLGISDGSLSVSSSISSAWRDGSEGWKNPGDRSRECQKNEGIQFTSNSEDAYSTQFFYSNYSQGFEKSDCDEVRHYYTPILNASTFVIDASDSLGAQYYIFDVLRSGVSSFLPYDFVDNSVNINPELVVKDIAVLPRMFADLHEIRSLFKGDDYILFGYDKDGELNSYFEAGTNPSNDMFWSYKDNAERIYGQPARTAFFNKLQENTNFTEDFYGNNIPLNNTVIGRIANSYIEISDYTDSQEISLQITPTYDHDSKILDYSLVGSLDLENIHDFIENGINGNPLSAKIWFNPDGSIVSSVPIKLYLYQGEDTNADPGEGFFEIEFNLDVESYVSGEDVRYEASQLWTLAEGSSIKVSFTSDGVTLSKDIINIDKDVISLSDANTGDLSDSLDDYIKEPANLDIKLLNLINKISEEIEGVKSFFTDGGSYTFMLDLDSGGHSIVAFNRNIVHKITGTFVTESSPEYAISVNDLIINENDSKDICFKRPEAGDLSDTSLSLSFTQVERPGKGGLSDDFSLSSTDVIFEEGDLESCVEFTALSDTHFDWAHDIYLNISNPTNGQPLARSRMKITILDLYFPNRIDWRRK